MAQSLQDQIIAIAVDDKRGQQVGLAVDDPVSVGVFNDALAILNGTAQALREKGAVDRNVLARQQPDGDLRLIAVKRTSVESAALVGEPHNRSGLGVCRADVAAIDPQVPRAQPFHTARADDDRSFFHDACLEK